MPIASGPPISVAWPPFGDEYPEARRILLYRGEHRLVRKGVLCLPVGPFLVGLNPERGIEDAVG